MVPILGGEAYENEAQWCKEKYNSTRCEDIRREAQDECRVASYILFTSNGVWALLLVALIWGKLVQNYRRHAMPVATHNNLISHCYSNPNPNPSHFIRSARNYYHAHRAKVERIQHSSLAHFPYRGVLQPWILVALRSNFNDEGNK